MPAEVITYRYNGKLVYVKPMEDYNDAMDVARKEFAEELANIPRENITFCLIANLNGNRRVVRVSESAWTPTVLKMTRGEVVDIIIRRPMNPDAKDDPPHYSEAARSHDSKAPSPSQDKFQGKKSWFTKVLQ